MGLGARWGALGPRVSGWLGSGRIGSGSVRASERACNASGGAAAACKSVVGVSYRPWQARGRGGLLGWW